MQISSHAAPWLDAAGAVDHVVLGNTSCLNLRYAKHLAAVTDDGFFEVGLRCRDCDGCRRYECLLLRRRLAAHFRDEVQPLWLVVVRTGLKTQSELRAKLYRMRNSCDWFGFFRLGDLGFALIARGARPMLSARGSFKSCAVKITRLRTPARARAWRVASAGLLISRSNYGSNRNRFYVRGLARVAGESFVVRKDGGMRKRHPETKAGALAWRDGLVLYPSARSKVASMMLALKSGLGARGRGLTVNSRRPKVAVSDSAVTGFRTAAGLHGTRRDAVTGLSYLLKHKPAATFLPDPDLNSIKGRGDASSKHSISAFTAEWLARMVDKSRARGGGG